MLRWDLGYHETTSCNDFNKDEMLYLFISTTFDPHPRLPPPSFLKSSSKRLVVHKVRVNESLERLYQPGIVVGYSPKVSDFFEVFLALFGKCLGIIFDARRPTFGGIFSSKG